MTRRPALLPLGALLLGLTLPAFAQEGQSPLITLPPAASPARPSVPEAAPPAAAEDPPVIRLDPAAEALAPEVLPLPVSRDGDDGTADTPETWLMPFFPASPLPQGGGMGPGLAAPGIMRLTGETAAADLLLVLPEGVALPESLSFTLRSSVNVLPDSAQMGISVNGAAPVQIGLTHLEGFGTVQVPTADLVTGENRIALTLRQPHRIFCGPEASFGVWTEIDLAQSGAAIAPGSLGTDASGFALALRSQIAGGRAVSLLTGDDTDPAVLRQVSDAVARVLDGQGRIDIRSFYSIGPQPYAAVALIASDKAAASFRRGASGAIVLQVEYAGTTVPDLSAVLPGPIAGGVGLPKVVPGKAVTFSGLGQADIIGNTHYFRKSVDFDLPENWLLMANQKARLDLHYGFARNLAEGAILLVKVNEQTVRLLPLDHEGGEMMPPLQVGFDANLLHPGRNALVFEMMVPGAPADDICPPRRADMLVVAADSSLTIPPSPPMVLRGMAAPLAALAPVAVQAAPGVADPLALDGVAVRIASGLARPADPDAAVSLSVLRLTDLEQAPLEDTGIGQRRLENLLFPAAPRAAPSAAEPATAAPAFRLSEDDAPPPAPAAPGWMSRGLGWLGRSLTADGWFWQEWQTLVGTAFVGTRQGLPDWMEAQSGKALLWRPDPGKPGALWLILAPDATPDAVSAALNRLVDSGAAAMAEAAVLGRDDEWRLWTPIRPPGLLAAPEAGTLRTILGNYASWSPALFMLATLLLAILSTLPALLYILLTRGQGGRP